MTYANRQGDLFAAVPEALPQASVPDTETIRAIACARLAEWLAAIRAASDGPPWPQDRHLVRTIAFHNMANWVPDEGEREELRAAFRAECLRLGLSTYEGG
jgi:hypothetical protein